ncbi:hypothetical protein ACE017_17310, partial [Shewanella mangrovisoli]|uniref:hypothetical protein n=1 Tax=Shewanella mangrovisoli TaxID=2864211 RepID=UPI0035B6F9E0
DLNFDYSPNGRVISINSTPVSVHTDLLDKLLKSVDHRLIASDFSGSGLRILRIPVFASSSFCNFLFAHRGVNHSMHWHLKLRIAVCRVSGCAL